MSNLKKVLRVLSAVFGMAVLPVLAGVDAQSATINVSADYLTIQGAINAASNGDTVLVDSGTYKENITFSGKAITVKSVNGTTSTIIDGNSLDSVVTFSVAETKDAVLEGFTITNGRASGGGIYCYKSSPTINNCTISNNTAASGGGGIYCTSSSLKITNCTITNNTANSYGGGIYCNSSSSVPTTVVNTIFWNDIPEEIFLKAASISITYSDIKGGWAGTGNINANPLFVSDNNEHLQSISPCINKGINTVPQIQSKDKDDNPRIVSGTIDMGAYEFQGGQVTPVTTPALSIIKTVDSNFASPGGIH
ncbi:MAG: choice-of-anchor Q domain-containing protein [bacterium]|nr:choice-of-anchor Q domain-containing protein [bacterium]